MATRNKRSTVPKAGILSTVSLLKEGFLYKRQRGLSRTDLRGLKFQQRYCRLTTSTFEYYANKKEHTSSSGHYQVAQIKMVEKVPDKTFSKKHFYFQIGNKEEVMYFFTNSDQDRDDWIEAFRIAAFELKSNTKLSHYHLGVFGQSEQNKWSCCKKGSRGADGCETVTQSDNGGSRKRQSSLPPQPDTSVEDIPPITQSLPAHGFLSDETERYEYEPTCGYYEDYDSDDYEESMDYPYPGTDTIQSQESMGFQHPGTGSMQSQHYEESMSHQHRDTGPVVQPLRYEKSMDYPHPGTGSTQSLHKAPMRQPHPDTRSIGSLDSGVGNSTMDLTAVGSPASARRNTYHGLIKRRSQDSILKDGLIPEESMRPESSSPNLSWNGPEVYLQSTGSPQLGPDSLPKQDNSATVIEKLDRGVGNSTMDLIDVGSPAGARKKSSQEKVIHSAYVQHAGSPQQTDSLPNAVQKTSSDKSDKDPINCPICEEPILNSSNSREGQDSVHCDGHCKIWIHRKCAGLSTKMLLSLRETRNPFFCLQCQLLDHKSEIDNVKNDIASLKESTAVMTSSTQSVESHLPTVNYSNTTSQTPSYATVTSKNLAPQPATPTNRYDKKFNIVVYGLEEPAKCTPRFSRIKQDFESVTTTLKAVHDSLSALVIRDCIRLGQYNPEKRRPVLVKFSRSCDVTYILSKRRNLASLPGIQIKPELSPKERSTRSTLLKERRSLINSDISRSDIRIRGNTIYLKGKKLGYADGPNFFSNHPTPSPMVSQNSSRSTSPSSNDDNSPPPSQSQDTKIDSSITYCSSSKQFLSSPSASFQASRSGDSSQADLQDAVDSFQECFDVIAKIVDPRELVSALFSASSKKNLPGIDRSHLKIISSTEFLEKANCHSGQEYKANVKILTDVWRVLDKTPGYIVAVLSALDKVLPDYAKKLKEQLGCSTSTKHIRQGSELSMKGYTTAPESQVVSGGSVSNEELLSPTVMPNGNGILPHMQLESHILNNGPQAFSNSAPDPSVQDLHV